MIEKIIKAKCRLLTAEPWYGHFSLLMEWEEYPKVPTMGVAIIRRRMICKYNPKFVESLSLEKLVLVIKHEIEHYVRLHCVRHKLFDNHEIFNDAADMTIHGHKGNTKLTFTTMGDKTVHKMSGPYVFVPDDWSDSLTVDTYYDKLMKEAKKHGGKGRYGNPLDDHSVWGESDTSVEEARQVVHRATQECTKQAGSVPGHLVGDVESLGKSRVNWRDILRQYMGKYIGTRKPTWRRMNRRRPQFGIKGFTKKTGCRVGVIADTSGSISMDVIKDFFAELESITKEASVHLLQWDHAFQSFDKYRKGDWKNIKVRGGGGTDMAAPIEWMLENYIPDVIIMLTDGYCSYTEPKPIPFVCVVTTESGDLPSWGHSIRITK